MAYYVLGFALLTDHFYFVEEDGDSHFEVAALLFDAVAGVV